MTSDHYAILGVTPTAETVVISAAYRALIRHYHPDTNPDPEAQARAREITAAYAVLRDPHKRAEYDARRSAEQDLWSEEERGEPVDRPRAPALRGVGMALAVLALGLVAAVWAWPQGDRSPQKISPPPSAEKSAPARTEPVVELQPESERLARLREETETLDAPPAIAPPPEDAVPIDPVLTPPATKLTAHARRVRPTVTVPKPVASPSSPRQPPAMAANPAPRSERVTTLERMASDFFGQSMAYAGAVKKGLLVSARDRSAAKRKACRSDSCVADAYVRQIRETSAIMEGRAGTPK